MTGNALIKHSTECPDARLDYVSAYCFGDLNEPDRNEFERHLLDCDDCWTKVRRLDQSIGILRTEERLGEPHKGYDMFVIMGISSRLPQPFGGHLWHVLTACVLYALLYAVALVLEVTYQLDQYRPVVWWVALGVFVWVFTTSVAGLGLDWKSAKREDVQRVSYYSIPIFIGAAVLLYVVMRVYLPDHPITDARFQTYPAHGAYLKDICYFLPLGVVFLVLPYHFVLSMQRELSAGRHRLSLALLSGEKWGVAPQGSIYPRVWWLGLLLFGAFMVSMTLTSHLLDNLIPGAFRSLFVQLVWGRVALYFSLGLACLFWYYRSLNEIKWECLGVVASAAQLSKGQN